MQNGNDNNRTYRIRTNVGSDGDKFVSFKIDNDINTLELLSLKIDTTNFYKLSSANYGCIAGRVLANGGVGVPNARISVFIGIDNEDAQDNVINALYPYQTVNDKNTESIRYNTLSDTKVSKCHVPVGTFPDKRLTLDDDAVGYVFDKYYKYTTRTNDSGDYMIFGVPTGEHVLHTDIDLSDIGHLSQKPRDMVYKGYNITQFENANKFKSDTNLDNLSQIISQNDAINVIPFWGEDDQIGITRADIDVQYKFEPTCVFIGSLVSDERSQGINKNCIATDRMGKMDRITTGNGTIEMIRKTSDGGVEEFSIQGNQVIDGNGVWCYQIPMNLDYYMTDEYGNFVPTNNKDKGIPTRTRVRFRVSLTDFQSDYENNHLSKVLVPNNPKTYDDLDYHFGSETQDDEFGTKSFRDLYWNNVYTVKSYIPRLQKGNGQRNKRFTGFKQVNVNGSNNPIPYNSMRVNLSFTFALQCAILKILIRVVSFINSLKKMRSSGKYCTTLGDGICPDLENWYYAPGCPNRYLKTTLSIIDSEDGEDKKSVDYNNRDVDGVQPLCITSKTDYLMQCVEINLAMEYEVIQFDFYNDWINGMVYIPRWFVNIRRKRSYLFGLIRVSAKTQACMEDSWSGSRRYVHQCALTYKQDDKTKLFTKVTTPLGCASNNKQKCMRSAGRKWVRVFNGKGGGGLVHTQKTIYGQSVYYFRPAEWLNINNNGYRTRCVLFATDIVLLGSLDECNSQGIPQAFTELTSSTYQMPTNLAQTNMDSEQYMYHIGGNGMRCTGRVGIVDKPIEIYPQTFENFVKWSKNSDEYEANPDDANEYPITEGAGIDWGYSGPKQGGNSFGNLYSPGGHFLGMSCFRSATNIKSCVNLKRICEIGSTMSQRQHFYKKENDKLVPSYLIPTGLINKYEITDSDFRKMFATMNFNGLKSKRNPKDGYLVYDFRPLMPTSFGGELEEKVSGNDDYNSGTPVDSDGSNTDILEYRSAIETPSTDYYRFRMGYVDEVETEQALKFLGYNSTNHATLPVYENSFYFYFGLKDGNTAIDRFFKEFYAECENGDEDASYFKVDVVNDSFCEDGCGSADVEINGVLSPYSVALEKDETLMKLTITDHGTVITENQNGSTVVVTTSSKFKFTGLKKGSYKLIMNSEDVQTAEYKFDVLPELKQPESEITFDFANFDENYYYNGVKPASERKTETTTGGYITLMNVPTSAQSTNTKSSCSDTTYTNLLGFMVYTDDYYCYVKTQPDSKFNTAKRAIEEKYANLVNEMTYLSGYTNDCVFKEDKGGGKADFRLNVWKGNDTYTVKMIIKCGDNDYRLVDFCMDNIMMNEKLDFYIGDIDLSFRRIMALLPNYPNGGNTTWLQDLLDSNSVSEVLKWKARQALYYRKSMFDQSEVTNLNVVPMNGVVPYREVLLGYGELMNYDINGYQDLWVSDNVMATSGDTEGYSLDMRNVMLPTHFPKRRPNTFEPFTANNGNAYGKINGEGDRIIDARKLVGGTIYMSGDGKSRYYYALADAAYPTQLAPTYSESAMVKEHAIGLNIYSVYKPFYFNAVRVSTISLQYSGNKQVLNSESEITKAFQYGTGESASLEVVSDDYNEKVLVTVTNAIPFNGKNHETLIINDADVSEDAGNYPYLDSERDYAEYDNVRHRYLNDGSRFYESVAGAGKYNNIEIGRLGLSVKIREAFPESLSSSNLSPMELEDYKYCNFPVLPNMASGEINNLLNIPLNYTRGVRFFVTAKSSVNMDLEKYVSFADGWQLMDDFSYRETPYTFNGIWGNHEARFDVDISEHEIMLMDVTDKLFEEVNEEGKVPDDDEKKYTNTWWHLWRLLVKYKYVLAAYDNATVFIDENYGQKQTNNRLEIDDTDWVPDTNNMGIYMLYKATEKSDDNA